MKLRRGPGWRVGGLIGVLVCAFAAVTWWRGWLEPDRDMRNRAAQLQDARSFARSLEVSLVSESSRVVSALVQAPVMNAETVTPAQHESLIQEVASFLHYRFGQRSPHAYGQWRRSTGYRLRDLAILKEPWGIERHHESYFGEPFPTEPDLDELYDRYNEAAFFYRGKMDTVSMSIEPKGLAVVYGSMSAAAPMQPQVSNGLIPDEFWKTGATFTKRRWWNLRTEHQQLLKEAGKTHCAVVGVFMEFGDGERMPMTMTFLWDPKIRQWALYWLSFTNTTAERTPGVEY